MSSYASSRGGNGGGANSSGASSNWRDEIQFNDNDKFFGNIAKVSNKYFQIESQNPSEDEVIVFTNNLKVIRGNPVLVTDTNKAVYLKEFNIRKANVEYADSEGNYDHKDVTETYAVKINKKYFKEYTFKSDFEGFSFDKPTTFDSLKAVAKEQEKVNKRVSVRTLIIGNSGFVD